MARPLRIEYPNAFYHVMSRGASRKDIYHIRYIHFNPVTANLVESITKFPWVSHKAYLTAKDDAPWLYARLGLAFFASKTRQALKAYREFISQETTLKPRLSMARSIQSRSLETLTS